jgi:hypothetical protein
MRPVEFVKLSPAYTGRLPGNVISFYIVPLAPAYKAGLLGHFPAMIIFSRWFSFCREGYCSKVFMIKPKS